MKLLHIISLLIAALFFTGCASQENATSTGEAAPATGSGAASDDSVGQKTAYEGSTGSGLLMERYKSGNIEGYRD
ncbi:hypothetical protein QEH59_15865 [Coraliomargarita sp. SDUM461004]|uniref:Argininosuccinate lyase n=1 Tax=Thalassobacterium sedimentorum TaxID=3041258 RepID=A0ABU1AM98_9BACT|nr:hypothetical protein [Coraliomargarita sp. SDUM461004]MDQ8195911.1 hypothetical protein [Coraliomargarita sp. SDUM461004]